ncbi:DUF2325 domain-containing protein [Thalassospiraceae bacterium LMO-JJ14]|nr:DUF2325 domain-containing protein [Thalassospiraceae bacterium LMO-JJ14]
MCEACSSNGKFAAAKAQRRKIWELSDGWHCSIVGTCLSLRDLRALGRKLDLAPKPGFPVDYQLHGHFVSHAASRNKTSKFLNTLLDRKHATAIRKLVKTVCPAELTLAWEEALEAGDIPGPFWALMSHPDTPAKLAERMFADVHMLSHLVGASNRADIRRLGELENDLAQAREDRDRERRHHAERMAEKSRTIESLEKKLAQGNAKTTSIHIADFGSVENDPAETDALINEARMLRSRLAAREREIEKMNEVIAVLRDEARDVEDALSTMHPDERDMTDSSWSSPDLAGRCILYVGGRPQSVNRYRQLLQNWNAEFLHHDGGQEKSIHELASAIARADTVVFPCDCVSHDAVCNVKKLCRQLMKTYVPLRTSGLAPLMAALNAKAGVEETDTNDSAPAPEDMPHERVRMI